MQINNWQFTLCVFAENPFACIISVYEDDNTFHTYRGAYFVPFVFHCFSLPAPPYFGLSQQYLQTPQLEAEQPEQVPQCFLVFPLYMYNVCLSTHM